MQSRDDDCTPDVLTGKRIGNPHQKPETSSLQSMLIHEVTSRKRGHYGNTNDHFGSLLTMKQVDNRRKLGWIPEGYSYSFAGGRVRSDLDEVSSLFFDPPSRGVAIARVYNTYLLGRFSLFACN